jgi:hypothetical protein
MFAHLPLSNPGRPLFHFSASQGILYNFSSYVFYYFVFDLGVNLTLRLSCGPRGTLLCHAAQDHQPPAEMQKA